MGADIYELLQITQWNQEIIGCLKYVNSLCLMIIMMIVLILTTFPGM